jgi:hypothetical protein
MDSQGKRITESAQFVKRAEVVSVLSAATQFVDELLLQVRCVVHLRDRVHRQKFWRGQVQKMSLGDWSDPSRGSPMAK